MLAASKAAYANTASTVDALTAQKAVLDAAIFNAKQNVATVENPVEVLSILGIATDFTDGEATGWTSTTGASNKQASNGNNAKDFSVTGNHYENWNWDAFSIGKVSATATGLATGVYQLQALAFSSAANCTYLYAGESQKLVTAPQIDIEQPMELYAIVTNGTLEIGLDVQVKGPNWIGLDNVRLNYLGNTADAYEALVTGVLNAEPDYEGLLEDREAYCQKSVYEAYKTAVANLKAATTPDALSTALSAFNQASKALTASIAAYGVYAKIYEEADEFINSTQSTSDEVELLSNYFYEETAAEGEYNGNGGAEYILENGLLDDAQIAAEAAYFEKLLNEGKANAKEDGDDCTDLLKNPNFAETGGWTSQVGPEWPVGDTATYPVVQVHNMLCDIYQELNNLQNGLYEFNLQAAFRPGDVYTDAYEKIAKAYAYVNSFETKIPSGNIPDVVTINEATEASAAFAEGKFPVVVYGLVTDGTMKIGITNKLRTSDGCRLWAGGAKLTFRGKNETVLAQVIAQTTPTAQALLSNYAGKPEQDALSVAIDNADGAEDAYHALVALKEAMDAVEKSTTLYANLKVALTALSEAIETSTKATAATISEAKATLEKLQTAYDSKSLGNAEAEQAISDLNAASVAVKMGGGTASEENPEDYTSMIVNNNFDPAKGSKETGFIEGWTTTAMNGYKENSVSYNRADFELNQKLSGLPKGKYKVTVHTYYRAGYYNEEEDRIAAGTETHLTTLYAETSAGKETKPVMNLTEGAIPAADTPGDVKVYTLSNGLKAPDGTTPSVAFFKAGYYLNELTFTVPEDGEVTIGLSKKETFANDYQVVGEWKLWYMGDADEAAKVDTIDMTDLLVNPTFDPAKGSKEAGSIEGWTTTAMNGYKEYTVSYNRSGFDLYQDLSGLMPGLYVATVHTYYRAGYYNEEEDRIAAGTETHLTTLYAETSAGKETKPVMNLTEGAIPAADTPGDVKVYTLSNGLKAPDGTTPSAAFFKAGYYLNSVEFTVPADGKVRIGLSKKETYANDYEVVGAWNLYYIKNGTPTFIEQIDTTDTVLEKATPVAYYSISGARLAAPQKGVNIVKMSNGQTQKIYVK